MCTLDHGMGGGAKRQNNTNTMGTGWGRVIERSNRERTKKCELSLVDPPPGTLHGRVTYSFPPFAQSSSAHDVCSRQVIGPLGRQF